MAEEIRARVTRRLATIALPVAGVSLALWLELLAAASFPMLSLTPFSLAVAISAWYGGFLGGATALLLSALGIDYFLLEPGTLLTLESPRQAFTFSVYVAGWLTFCAMAGRAYRRMLHDGQARLDAERVARQSDRLAQLTAALGQARTPAAVMDATV
ncbi:MAG TPA: DUF4118 domain-containing protein, partial [Vicinamibacterales bacterium]|nr:DUF4118 domain-containing protein [Vicinamibacterales bacterium]